MTTPPPNPARRIWHAIEPIHAVTYFAPTCRDSFTDAGLKGFWMGYFGGRSAPFGGAPASLVEATFYNFAPALVRRAVPSAWTYATPADVLTAREAGAARALRELVPAIDGHAERIVPLLEGAARAARCEGRPLAAVNQARACHEDPVVGLWQAATTLREHRGDGHVSALVSSDIGGLDANVLAVAGRDEGGVDAETLRTARGWTIDEWADATDRLTGRGLIDDSGGLTDVGRFTRDRIETQTDDLATQPYRDSLTDTGLDLLLTLLRPLAATVLGSGLIPFPNPIGLPRSVPLRDA